MGRMGTEATCLHVLSPSFLTAPRLQLGIWLPLIKIPFPILPFYEMWTFVMSVIYVQSIAGQFPGNIRKAEPYASFLFLYPRLKLEPDCYLDPKDKESRFCRAESWREPEPDELHRTTIPALDYQNYLSTNFLQE